MEAMTEARDLDSHAGIWIVNTGTGTRVMN